MQHLLSVWNELLATIKECPVMLFLDYDGTLTPIVRHPSFAKLSLTGKKLLRSLVRTEGIKTVIVSGRSLADMKDRMDIPGLIYVGNHGLEFEGPQIRYVHPMARASKKLLRQLAKKLAQSLKFFPKVFVENKALTLSVHYRQLSPSKVKKAKKVFLKTLRPYLRYAQIVFTRGKKVWEVRPPTRWNKGRIVLWLLARMVAHTATKFVPIYIGDDRTDEDAFKAIRRRGIGIKVTQKGNEVSHAGYYLRSTGEVFDFLRRLKMLKKREKKSYAGL